MGHCHRVFGDTEKAISAYKKSIQIADDLNYQDGLGNAYESLGNLYALTGDELKAESYLIKSLEIFRQHSNRNGEISSSMSLSQHYYDQGEILKSSETVVACKRLLLSTGNRQLYLEAQLQSAKNNAILGKRYEALTEMRFTAMAAREARSHYIAARCYWEIAKEEVYVGNLKDARVQTTLAKQQLALLGPTHAGESSKTSTTVFGQPKEQGVRKNI